MTEPGNKLRFLFFSSPLSWDSHRQRERECVCVCVCVQICESEVQFCFLSLTMKIFFTPVYSVNKVLQLLTRVGEWVSVNVSVCAYVHTGMMWSGLLITKNKITNTVTLQKISFYHCICSDSRWFYIEIIKFWLKMDGFTLKLSSSDSRWMVLHWNYQALT